MVNQEHVNELKKVLKEDVFGYQNYSEESDAEWIDITSKEKKYTINFICADLGINGGTKSIISIANALTDLGHNVNVIYPKYLFPHYKNKKTIIEGIGMPLMRLKRELLGQSTSEKTLEHFKARCNIIKAKRLIDKYIPDADFTFATWWETALYVKNLSNKKGKKCYLVQHYEVWGGNKDRVIETYNYGFINIVHSSWLEKKLVEEAKSKVAANISHCPEHDQFKVLSALDVKNKLHKDEFNVMMIYRNIEWKGMDYGIRGYELAYMYNSNIKLILVGDRPKVLPPNCIFYEHPSTEKLNELYNISHCFLFPSIEEGFGLPPMEAMCAGSAVISTKVGGVPDYIEHNITGLLVDTKSEYQIAEAIEKLYNDKKLCVELVVAAEKSMHDYTWNNYAKKLLKVLKNG